MHFRLVLFRVLALFCLAGVIWSFFLPFVDRPTDGMTGEDFMIVRQDLYDDGYRTIFNGFGSPFAYFQALLAFILLFVVFGKDNTSTVPRAVLWFHLGSHLLVLLSDCAAGYTLSRPDKLLLGYAVMSVSAAGLILVSYGIVHSEQRR